MPPVGDGVPACAVTDLIAVGTKPAGDGRWGQSDLAGNVWEWTLDWYAPYATPCEDCANLTAASYRVIRGGGFDGNASYLRASNRSYFASDRYVAVGVRCARPP